MSLRQGTSEHAHHCPPFLWKPHWTAFYHSENKVRVRKPLSCLRAEARLSSGLVISFTKRAAIYIHTWHATAGSYIREEVFNAAQQAEDAAHPDETRPADPEPLPELPESSLSSAAAGGGFSFCAIGANLPPAPPYTCTTMLRHACASLLWIAASGSCQQLPAACMPSILPHMFAMRASTGGMQCLAVLCAAVCVMHCMHVDHGRSQARVCIAE